MLYEEVEGEGDERRGRTGSSKGMKVAARGGECAGTIEEGYIM